MAVFSTHDFLLCWELENDSLKLNSTEKEEK
jgi:hypothetical protein